MMAKEDILARYRVPRLGDLRLDQIDYAVIEDFKVILAGTRNARVKCEVQVCDLTVDAVTGVCADASDPGGLSWS